MDAFDEIEPQARLYGYAAYVRAFADFLLDLQEQGQEWAEFRSSPSDAIDHYLSGAVAEGALTEGVASAVRWALNPHEKKLRALPSRNSLHPADKVFFDDFYPHAIASMNPGYPSVFAAFLCDLREHGVNEETEEPLGWLDFCDLSDDQINLYVKQARERGLHASTGPVVRLAMNPQDYEKQRKSRAKLTHPDDLKLLEAVKERADRGSGRSYLSDVRKFLDHLRTSGDGMSWEKFSGSLSEDERNTYLKKVSGKLGQRVPRAVRWALAVLNS